MVKTSRHNTVSFGPVKESHTLLYVDKASEGIRLALRRGKSAQQEAGRDPSAAFRPTDRKFVCPPASLLSDGGGDGTATATATATTGSSRVDPHSFHWWRCYHERGRLKCPPRKRSTKDAKGTAACSRGRGRPVPAVAGPRHRNGGLHSDGGRHRHGARGNRGRVRRGRYVRTKALPINMDVSGNFP